MRVFVATSNAGKLRDFAVAAEAFAGVAIEALPGLADVPAPVEDAETFAGNALIKATAYSRMAPGEIVVADDSGISVPALGGVPGVRSARFAEDAGFGVGSGAAMDLRNSECLLAKMVEHPFERKAFYSCVLVAVRDGVVIATGEGRLDGELLFAGRGEKGFGYDPLFLLPELGLTMAEVDGETRLRLSHRGRALVDLLGKMRGIPLIA